MSGPTFIPPVPPSADLPNPQNNQSLPPQQTIAGRLWQLLTSNFLAKIAQRIVSFAVGIFASKKASTPSALPSAQPAQKDDLTTKTSEVARQADVVPPKESPKAKIPTVAETPVVSPTKPARKVAVEELKPKQESTSIQVTSKKVVKQAPVVLPKEKPKAAAKPAATLPKAQVLVVTESEEKKSLAISPKKATPAPLSPAKTPHVPVLDAAEFKEEKSLEASPASSAKKANAQAAAVLPKEMPKAEVKLAAPVAAEQVQDFSNFHISPEKVQNVPDDGSCLVYALAVGLKKKGANEIQAKLNWDIDLEQLKGDLRVKYQGNDQDSDRVKAEKQALNQRVLSPAAQKLRNEAADLLKAKLTDPENGWLWQMRLQEDMALHNQVIHKQIKEQDSLLPLLKAEVTALTHFLETLNQGDVKGVRDQFSSSENLQDLFKGSNELRALKQRIMDPQTQSLKDEEGKISTHIRRAKAQKEAEVQESEKQNAIDVAALQKKLIDPNSAEAEAKFIELMRETDFYCGPNQMAVLSELYGVTIAMWKPARISAGTSQESFIQNSKDELRGQVLKPTLHTHEGKKGVWMADLYGREEKGPIIHVLHVNGNHFQYLDQ
jgi:hypothetical protein